MEHYKRTVIYPGTFDPVTKGHVDIIRQALKLFDKVIVLLADNKDKKTMFHIDDRLNMVEDVVKSAFGGSDSVEVVVTDGLTCNYKEHNGEPISGIVRGVRHSGDAVSELNMAWVNTSLGRDTVFIPASREYLHISSSVVRELLKFDAVVEVEEYLCRSTIRYIMQNKHLIVG